MSAITGCGASFLLGTNEVASLKNVSNPITADALDTTSFDSECMREFLAGLRSGTIDISGDFNPEDTNGQQAMMTAMLAGTFLETTQKPKILWDGVHGMTADGIITNLTIEATVDGLVTFSATLNMSGAITVI